MALGEEERAASIFVNEEALYQRMEEEKGKMYGIAYAYLRNETDALEAIQETVCRVWIKRRTLREERFFSTWMIRILIHVCIDERKKKKREKTTAHEQLDRAAVSTDSVEKIDMAAHIAKLPPKYRMVIVLKYYRDLTIKEIAELLEKPDGTIRTWLHKALKMMRAEMGGEEVQRHERAPKEGWGWK
jgi:RNA polymerase sigma-70 factor (TIGR02954 family)